MTPARCGFIISPQELTLLFSCAAPIRYPKEGTVPMVLSRNQVTPTCRHHLDAERLALLSWAIRVFPSTLFTFWGLQEVLIVGLWLTAPRAHGRLGTWPKWQLDRGQIVMLVPTELPIYSVIQLAQVVASLSLFSEAVLDHYSYHCSQMVFMYLQKETVMHRKRVGDLLFSLCNHCYIIPGALVL